MADANRDDKLVAIRDEFGLWGIGLYWTLVEMVAEQMKPRDPKPEAILLVPVLCSFAGCKPDKLRRFLELMRNQRGMLAQLNGNQVRIEIPKLLEIKDNFTSHLQVTSKRLTSKKGEVEEEVEEEGEKTHTSVDCRAFLVRWNEFALENGIAPILKITDRRKAWIRSRSREPEFDFERILAEIAVSDFLRGISSDWRVDFDFVFRSQNNYMKILEGKYRNGNSKQRGKSDYQKRAEFRAADDPEHYEQLRKNLEGGSGR